MKRKVSIKRATRGGITVTVTLSGELGSVSWSVRSDNTHIQENIKLAERYASAAMLDIAVATQDG